MSKCFEKFLKFFGEKKTVVEGIENVLTFTEAFSGKEFENGAFKVFKKEETEKWNNVVKEMFPDYSEQFLLFGYDWLGRFYATDEYENIIFVFDPSTNDIMDLENEFAFFINKTLLKNANDILALKLYKKYLKKNSKPLFSNCVGYKVPLFLGGEDSLENFEESDMEVYWSISAQIIAQIREKANGTVVDSFTINQLYLRVDVVIDPYDV